MKKIAFLISSTYEQDLLKADGKFFNEYEFLREIFLDYKFELKKTIWDLEKDYSQYQGLIFKAIWDYYERPLDFKPFLQKLKKEKLKFCNSLDTVMWNMEKTYLVDIENADLPVIPFQIIENESDINKAVRETEGETLIIKPTISGGSRHTIKTKKKDIEKHLPTILTILKESKLMLQPFVPEVMNEGEYSFLFFGGKFSHALLKKPKEGDFRAHSFFGGNNYPYAPTALEIEQVARYLKTAPDFPDYARVDVVKKGKLFYLMELELIEPYLYFETAVNQNLAGKSFVQAVTKLP